MSTLLEQASLVLIPSGYKEDTVYSVIPSNGSGDMSFTRASDGTRINSDGLVEVCPWNLFTYSEQFQNANWTGGGNGKPTMTDNFAEAPNGTFTASKMEAVSDGYQLRQNNAIENTQMNLSVYLRTNIGTKTIQIFLNNGSTAFTNATVTTTWQRFEISGTVTTLVGSGRNGLATLEALTSSEYILVWGAQISVSSTAKPYFPTTDRLNVPRLTYQNGGGGCPSLLLEPQRTNIVKYSQEFDSVFYVKTNVTITANTTISPDGTQNADTATYTGNGYFDQTIAFAAANLTHTISCWVKVPSGTQIFRLKITNATVVDYFSPNLTATTEWQRFTFTQAFGAVSGGFIVGVQCSTIATLNIWGLQLETNSSYASSYIPTTSASATKIADGFSRSNVYTNGFITASGGTWFVELTNQLTYTRDNGNNTLILADLLGTNFFRLRNDGSVNSSLRLQKSIAGITTDLFILYTGNVKIAVKWNGTTADAFLNGTKIVSASPFTATQLENLTSVPQVPIFISQMILFPTALSDSNCVTLTTI
jgi:hypothetical protein